MNNNKELNQAIWTVITSKYKKDAPEAFKLVSSYGYEICKNGFGWEISSSKRRIFTMERGYASNKHLVIVSGYYRTMERVVEYKEFDTMGSKFDFVNCLNTPINDIYYQPERPAKSISNYKELLSRKSSINYENHQIQEIKAQIDSLQKSLIHRVERKTKEEMDLAKFRKEIGLSN